MRLVSTTVEINVRSAAYLLAHSVAPCERCRRATAVYALALLPGHERSVDDGWQAIDASVLLFYVDYLTPDVWAVTQELAPRFRRAFSAPTAAEYWLNHCQHCDAPLEDFDLHCEPGGAFCPLQSGHSEKILLINIRSALAAQARGFSEDFLSFASTEFIA